MNPGLPGTGIGGLFYIGGALLMPLKRGLDRALGRRAPIEGAGPAIVDGGPAGRSPLRVGPPAAIAAGILLSLFATGWLLGLALPPQMVAAKAGAGVVTLEAQSVVRWVAIVGTGGVLLLVLTAVELARVLARTQARGGLARHGALTPDQTVVPVTPSLSDVA